MAIAFHVGQYTYVEALFTFISHDVAMVTRGLWTMLRADGADSL